MRTFTSSDGLQIKVGENATENQTLCKNARQNDLWFHLDNQASPHVILSTNGTKPKSVPNSIHECEQLVKHFSSAREMRQVNVIWIEAKFVSKNGVEDRVGAVTLKKSPNKVSVVQDEPTISTLLAGMSKK